MDETAITPLSHAASAVLEAALGALPVPAYTNDLLGFVTWQNAASRAVAGDLRGTHYSDVLPPNELARSRETFAAVTVGGVARRRIGFFRSSTGALVELEVITAPIRMRGEIIGTFGIAIPSVPVTSSRGADQLSPRQLDVLRLLVPGGPPRRLRMSCILHRAERLHHVGTTPVLVPPRGSAVRLVGTFENAEALFRAVCDRGLEGIVAERQRDRYRSEERVWRKAKNREMRRFAEEGRGCVAGTRADREVAHYVRADLVHSQRHGSVKAHIVEPVRKDRLDSLEDDRGSSFSLGRLVRLRAAAPGAV
jgi:hypothetical protein